MDAELSSKILATIRCLAEGTTGGSFEETARKFNALPLYEGWDGWLLLTVEGDVLVESEGRLSACTEPLRTFGVVMGVERYPELKPLLPIRPSASEDCPDCKGTGWFHVQEQRTHMRCGKCRALGWVEMPSNNALERTREQLC